MSRKVRSGDREVQDVIPIALKVRFIDRTSTDEFQLMGVTERRRLRLLADTPEVMFIEVFLNKHERHVAAASWRDEGSVHRPVKTGQ